MTRFLKIAAALIVLHIVAMTAIGVAINVMLDNLDEDGMRGGLAGRLPVDVVIGDGGLDLVQWMLFRPTLSLTQIRVANPDGFSAEEPLATLDEASLRADLIPLLSDRRVVVRSIELRRPVLHVQRNAAGESNVEQLVEALRADASTPDSPASEDGTKKKTPVALTVESLTITEGEIILPPARPGLEEVRIEDYVLSLSDCASDSTCTLRSEAASFGGAIQARIEGRAGPFERTAAAPFSGKLYAEAFPAQLPENLRSEIFGELLAAPGDDSRIELDVDVEGRQLESLEGSGQLSIDELWLGRPDRERLPLSGQTPLKLTGRNPLGALSFEVSLPEAVLKLGEGKWSGDAELHYARPVFRGVSTGRIEGVDVNQFMSAFTDNRDEVFGLLAVRDYQLAFRGQSAGQMRSSLNGSGRLGIEKGRLAAFDMFATVEQHVQKLLGGEQAVEGETEFLRLASDFEIRDERVFTPDLALETSSGIISGAGSFSFGGALDYALTMEVDAPIAVSWGGTKIIDPEEQVSLPVTVRGSFSDPKVRPDVSSMAIQQAVKTGLSLLESLLGNREEDVESEAPAPQPTP